MVKSTELREWFSIAIAIGALAVSAYAVVQARQANQARKELVTITAEANETCQAEYIRIGNRGELGLCWSVILANDSEDRLSIIKYRVFSVQHGQLAWFGGFRNLEGEDGKPISPPLILNGGEARRVIVRAGFPVPAAVARVIGRMPEFKSAAHAPVSLGRVQHALAAAGLDYIGNSVQRMFYEGKLFGWALSPGARKAVAVLHVETGRGNEFSKTMSYPSTP